MRLILIAVGLALVIDLAISSMLLEGNKRRSRSAPLLERKPALGNCQPFIHTWKTWDGGFSGQIRVQSGEAVDEWSAHVELNKPVSSLEAYNGLVDVSSGQSFTVKSTSYNGRVEDGEEKEFTIQGKLSKDEVSPLLKSIQINQGEQVVCKGDGHLLQPLVKASAAGSGHKNPWPKRVVGLYVLLADDSEEGFESESTSWDPQLFPWQQQASNVLFFTFIHPDTMDIPPAFEKLAASRGTNAPGAVPKDTVIMFAIGGYAYSIKPNPWHWLTSKEAAEEMAVKVAKWYDDYNVDGIDLDLEEGAGARKEAGPNMIHFIRKLRQLQPNMIISQPTYGYPQVQAEIDVINASWDTKGKHQGLADIIGLMVYEGTLALQYVKNYNKGSEQWEGFPIKVNAPSNTILLGAKGATSSAHIKKLAQSAVDQDLAGIMVWYASIKNGFDYSPAWDASTVPDSIDGYKAAMRIFNDDMQKNGHVHTVMDEDPEEEMPEKEDVVEEEEEEDEEDEKEMMEECMRRRRRKK